MTSSLDTIVDFLIKANPTIFVPDATAVQKFQQWVEKQQYSPFDYPKISRVEVEPSDTAHEAQLRTSRQSGLPQKPATYPKYIMERPPKTKEGPQPDGLQKEIPEPQAAPGEGSSEKTLQFSKDKSVQKDGTGGGAGDSGSSASGVGTVATSADPGIFTPTAGGDSKRRLVKSDIPLSTKALVIDPQGRILTLKDAYSDWQDLPGGHVDSSESPEEALKRELHEEIGLEVEDPQEFDMTGSVKIGKDKHPVLFYVVHAHGEPKLSKEHTSYKWTGPQDLDGLNLGQFRPIINKWFSLKKSDNVYEWVDNMVFKAKAETKPVEFSSLDKADEFNTLHNGRWFSVLTPEERSSYNYYTADGYKHLNKYLRGYPYGRRDREELQRHVTNLDSAIRKYTFPHDTIVYRGIRHQNLDELVGKTATDKGYVSTTLHPSIARLFAATSTHHHVARILIPGGTHVGVGNRSENELLLPRNTRIHFTRSAGVIHGRVLSHYE